MEPGPVTKIDKRNASTFKKSDDGVMMTNGVAIVLFSIYGQFAVIRKLDSGCIVYKTYIFINSNLFSYKI